MSGLVLHSQLKRDCFIVGRFPLSLLLLMNDSSYPWFILVPQRQGITEVHQLSELDQQQLMRESSILSACIEREFHADKINIAALGNMVPQLHIHHIVRYVSDPVWPAPIWGEKPAAPYADEKSRAICEKMKALLKGVGLKSL